jgi:phosphoribosylaminoimidazole-succinocarboxamide synthase
MAYTGLAQTDFQFPNQTNVYHGKVRDMYTIGNRYLVAIVSDRISAFDAVLPKPIPYKGQVLNQIGGYFLKATKSIVPNWLLSVPDPNVTIGKICTPYRVEMVIRGYLSGHAAREYKLGLRTLSGTPMPDGLSESDPFPKPIITPTTKAEGGHDLDISKEEIIEQGIIQADEYEWLERYTRDLYRMGTEMAAKRGLILVDTKYEFGKGDDGEIYVIDEVHTPDSSRYFYADGYEARQKKGEPQKQLSKEFVRQWLIENNFMGHEGQQVPEMPDSFVHSISERYIELYEKITGEKFSRGNTEDISERIEKNVNMALKTL